MLQRINELLKQSLNFAFETTLSTKTYQQKIIEAQKQGYFVTLLSFWLNSTDLAKERVRVSEGAHNILKNLIERRYYRGLKNLFELYTPICDNVMLFDNLDRTPVFVMETEKGKSDKIFNEQIFEKNKK